MTAPSAPHIIARTDGEAIYVRWRPVPTATSYKVYISDHTTADDLVETVTDVEDDGWCISVTASYAGPNWVNATAVNAGAEESAASNEVALNLRGMGAEPSPTPARRKAVKSL